MRAAKITHDALNRKYSEYSAAPDNPGVPQLFSIFGVMLTLLEDEVFEATLVERFIANIEAEYRDFHSGLPLSKGSENWRTKKTVQLLYGDAIKIDAAYEKRAERYLRGMIDFEKQCTQVECYLARKAHRQMK